MTATAQQVIAGKSATPALYLVSVDGKVVGQLERYARAGHPWKAYLGTGEARRFVAAFYGPTGRKDAIGLILALHEKGR